MNGGDCRPLLSSYVEASGLRASQWVFDQRGGSGVRSSCHSNERRRGSDGFNATAVAVDKNARCDFQLQCAVGGDDSYLKRSGSSMPPILSTHSLLSTTDFLSCLSCSPFDRRLTGQLRPGHGTMIYVAGPRSFERALPALAHASERRRLLCAMNRLLRALLEAEPTRGP